MKPYIYTTEDILERILLGKDDAENCQDLNIWFDFIIKVRPHVKLLLRENSDFGIEQNLLLRVQKSYDLDINEIDKEEISTLLQMFSFTSDLKKELNPRAILLFAIPQEDALQISEKYGCICHSVDETPCNCPLFLENIDVWCEEKEYYEGWNKLMKGEVLRPVNSLIFIDRYFLSGDSSTWKKAVTKEDAIKNLRYFLERILPNQLVGEFHLLLVFDDSAIWNNNNRQKFVEVTIDINKMIKEKIIRPYRIVVELLSTARNEYDNKGNIVKAINNNKTHNRRIISNHYIIRAEHSLKIQCKKRNLYSQSLSLDWYASKGFIRNLDSDYMGRYLDSSIMDIKKIINELKGKDGVFFSQNGELKPISEIVNRLVK